MTADDPILLAAENVSLAFGRRTVLDDVTFALRRREVVTVIGPNGAGKTTLLRVLLGLQRQSAGRVMLAPQTRVGYVPQRVHVDDSLPLSVDRFLRLARPPGREAVIAVLREVGAETLADLPLQSLSGGEFQRVLLARALLRNPDLLVLDEPAQGVDVVGQSELFQLIRRIRDRHACAVLLVSHDLHLVMAATDRVICLNHHVCCSGHPETVSRHPAYRALFGHAAESFALYAHHHDHAHDAADDRDRQPSQVAGHG